MTTADTLENAKSRMRIDDCFWGSNAMLYGERTAIQRVKQSEAELRQLAGEIITEGTVGKGLSSVAKDPN